MASKKEEFFEGISEKCGYIDVDTVEKVYYALIRELSKQLRERNSVEMPDWGEFYLHRHLPRIAYDVNKRTVKNLEAKTTVKFSPNFKMKAYFHEVQTKKP